MTASSRSRSPTMWPFSKGAERVSVPDVDVREAQARLRHGARLVDVRTAQEFRSGHVRGSRNVSPEQIAGGASGLEPDDEILVICLSGARSARAARRLAGMGFTNVSNVRGGLSAWQAAGLPIKK
jgi:rhodanese-related sulfurtransferase